jgi:hypothetical protein
MDKNSIKSLDTCFFNRFYLSALCQSTLSSNPHKYSANNEYLLHQLKNHTFIKNELMNKDTILKTIFGISFIFTIIGIAFKIMHIPSFIPFLALGIGFSAVYTLMVLLEILPSKRLNLSEKLMWLTGFLFFNAITGFLYFTGGRKKVV